MKFLKSHNVKYSTKLFQNRYKYKVVFTSGVAGWFRGSDVEKIQKYYENDDGLYYSRTATAEDKDHARKLAIELSAIQDNNWQTRVESPFVSVYVNTEKDLETVVKNCKERIKYVEIPDPNSENKLAEGIVLVKNLDFNYKVTVGSSTQCHLNFVQWCENNAKIRLPKRAQHDLSRDRNYGGGFFYVKDEKTLMMVKMFLGRTITKVETVVRA
jgi:hypothetical protein